MYIHDSTIAKANASLAEDIKGKCPLGRPWNALHRSIFSNCFLDDSVLPEGYIEWVPSEPRVGVNTTMAEYKNKGPGWDARARAKSNVSIVMDKKAYRPYNSIEKVFQWPGTGKAGNTRWVDQRAES